jgi:putative transposase
VTLRVAYARELVAAGHRPAVVARILRISRQAIYRIPKPRRAPDAARRPPVDEVELAIVALAERNPTDGYRLVTAWVCRQLGQAINRKRVLRVMRERKLIQRRTHEPKRPLAPLGATHLRSATDRRTHRGCIFNRRNRVHF